MIRNIINLFLGRIVLVAVQFTSLLITNRLLGPDGRGLFASASTWSMFFFILFYLSINTMYLKECSDKTINRTDLKNGFFSFAVLLSLTAIIAGVTGWFLLNKQFIQLPWNIYLLNILAIPFMIIQALTIAVYQSEQQFKKVNIAILATSICNLLFIVISTVVVKFNVTVISTITLLSWIFCGIYCYADSNFKFSWNAFKKIFYKKFVEDLSFLHINTIMTFFVTGFNILLIHKYISDNETGQYFLANTIAGYLLLLPISIQNVLVANLIDKSNRDKAKTTSVFFKASILGMLLVVIIMYLFSDLIVLMLGGRSFVNSGYYLQCLLATVVFQVAGIIWSTLWTMRGYFKIVTKISFAVVLLSVILNFTLIKRFGVEGAIISTLIITFLSFGIHMFLAVKEFRRLGLSSYEIIPQKSDLVFLVRNMKHWRLKNPKTMHFRHFKNQQDLLI